MNKDVVISIRIDLEMQEMISYLKEKKIRHCDIIRNSAKESLKTKCTEMKFREKKEYLPF